jgi:beta-galactosidase
MAAVTKHSYGKGCCYYIAARTENTFLQDFYRVLAEKLSITAPPVKNIPKGVSITKRSGEEKDYYFIMNYSEEETKIQLNEAAMEKNPKYLLTNEVCDSHISLGKYDYQIVALDKDR